MATEEEEEYYDSIDDTELQECRSFCNDNFDENDSEADEEDCNKIDELVPFYTGNVVKSELETIKNDSKSSIVTLRNKKLNRSPPLTSLADHRKNRSYLTMFYSRKNQQIEARNPETSRATCSNHSPKANLSYYNDYYENANSESTYNNAEEPFTHEVQNTIVNNHTFRSESESTVDSKLISVSEAHYNSVPSSRRASKRDGRSNSTTKPLKMCELGGLGPNITHEKLELLRRRQDYGKTVSEKNRIKIMEKKVVRKLKQEIRKCNKI